jgi:hypothetical protein
MANNVDLSFTVTALDRAAKTLEAVAQKLDRLSNKLDKLDGKTATAKVEVDTDKAEREIGAFAANMQKRISAAIKALPDIELNADSSDADRRIVELRKELAGLSGKRIGVDISAEDARAAVERIRKELAKVNGSSASVQVKADTAAAIASLEAVEGKVKNLDGKSAKVKVDTDKSLSDSLIQFTRLGAALKALAIPAGLATAAPQLASLGAAAMATVGAVGLIPGAVGAAGVAAATASLSFGKLVTYFTAASDKKKTEAFNELSASGKNLATTIDGLKPRFEALRTAVQDSAFEGLAAQVKPLADTYFPMLQRTMVAIAAGFNVAATSVAAFFRQKDTAASMSGAFASIQTAVRNVTVAVKPLVQAFTDVFVVGTSRLPGLTAGVGALAEKFAAFIRNARESGQLGAWIDLGIAKIEQLGRITQNVGGILMSIFRAADSSGADFLSTVERITGGINTFLRSAEGQTAIVALFREIKATVDALAPGFQALGSAAAYVIAQLGHAGVLREAGAAISALVISVAPLARDLADMAGNILPPILRLITALAPAIGPVVAAFVAWKVASAGIGAVQGAITNMSTKLSEAALNAGTLTEKFTGSAAAGEKMATAGSKVSGAMNTLAGSLPLIGLGIAGISTAYEIWGGKADQAAQKVIGGSLSMSAAIAKEGEQIHSNQIEWLGGMNAQESYAAAAKNVKTELDAQMAALSPMARLQAEVAMAQANLNDAVAQFGPKSSQAVAAAAELNAARDREKSASDGAKEAEKSLGDAIVDTTNKAAGAANADLAYQQSLLSLKDAQLAAAKAAKEHAAGSDEVTRANLAVQQASIAAAEAAKRKAQADAEAAGASNSAEIGAQAYKDELIRQAATMTGPNRAALDVLISKTGGATDASKTAEIQARLQKDELGRLAATENGPLKSAIEGTIKNFDTLGGAHASAEQRSTAQRAALSRLAEQAQGPTKAAIMQMIGAIDAIHDKSFTVTGTGKVSYGAIGGPDLVRMAHGGHTGGVINMNRAGQVTGVAYADGGVLPGYTPGRDVHRFQAANGSVLDLSGGEAVMRPEWTAAVGPSWVHAANRAARQGGIAGATDFMSRTAPRSRGEGTRGDGNAFANGGIIGGRFAGGGVVLNGQQPFKVIPPNLDIATFQEVVDHNAPLIAARIRAAEAQLAAQAAAAGGVSPVAGGGAAAALAWARTQVGKPYIWGAVGPRGYDCSGFMSAITNVMRGRNPYSRVGATGSFPWAGFAPGLGGQFAIGAFRGNPGHMAGTLAPGINVESSGGVGVRVGGGARGASNGMFSIRGHIGDRGGIVPHGTAAVNMSGSPERLMDPAQTRIFDQIRAAVSGGRASGGIGGGEVVTLLRSLAGYMSALRGDVDHHGDQAAIAARLDVTNRLLASAAGGTAAVGASGNRFTGELGAF